MRQRLFVLASLVGLGLSAPAWAQDKGSEFDNITGDDDAKPAEEPAATPEATPEPTPGEPMMASAGEGGNDHDTIIGHWGVEVVALALGGETFQTPDVIPLLGVRKWGSADTGWEAGAALAFVSDGGDPAQTTLWAGGSFGLMKALAVFKHNVVFWEPQGTLLIVVPNDGNDATDDKSIFILDGRFNVGTEVRLGMIGLQNIAVTTRLSAGIQVVAAENTGFFIGTEGGVANSIRGLIEGDVGFVINF